MASALPFISAGAAGIGALGSLFGGGQGEEVEYKPVNPEASQMQNQLMGYLMNRMGQQQPYARVNPMAMNAMNMASNFYTGSPYMHPGFGGQQQNPMQQPQPTNPFQGGGGGRPPAGGGRPGAGGRRMPNPPRYYGGGNRPSPFRR